MMLPTAYLIVSGSNERPDPHMLVFGLTLEKETAESQLPEIEQVAGMPCRIIPICITEPLLVIALDQLDRAEVGYTEAEKGESYTDLRKAVRVRESASNRVIQYILKVWRKDISENAHESD